MCICISSGHSTMHGSLFSVNHVNLYLVILSDAIVMDEPLESTAPADVSTGSVGGSESITIRVQSAKKSITYKLSRVSVLLQLIPSIGRFFPSPMHYNCKTPWDHLGSRGGEDGGRRGVHSECNLFLLQTDPLLKAMTAFAAMLELPLSKMRFTFDGDPIDPSQTATDLGMDDDDIIDATILVWVCTCLQIVYM